MEEKWKCPFCDTLLKNASVSQIANHSRWCKSRPNRFQLDEGFKINVKNRRLSNTKKKFGELIDFNLTCSKCGKIYIVKDREKKFDISNHKKCCSRKCAAHYGGKAKVEKYGRSDHYTRICFSYHKKECIICGERKIVAVHHYDKDHSNISRDNLIPLCPTHHQYMHSRHRKEIEEKINTFRLLNGTT